MSGRKYKDKYQFEINTSLVFFLNIVGNFLSYLFQIIMARMLSIEEYGKMNVVFTIQILATIPATILGATGLKYITEAIALGRKEDEYMAEKTVIYFFLICVGGVVGLTFLISSYFMRFDIAMSIIIAISTIFAGLNAMIAYILQGEQRFFQYGMINVVVCFIRLVFGTVIVILGGETMSLLFVVIFAWIITDTIVFLLNRSLLRALKNVRVNLKEQINGWKSVLLCMIYANLGLQILMNIDNILVRLFFSEQDTGYYASANTLARVAMYISNALVVVMFPKVIQEKSNKDDTNTTIIKTIVYGMGATLIISLIMALFSNRVVCMMFGEDYIQASKIVRALIVYIAPLTLVNILVNYMAAMNLVKEIGITLMIGVIMELLLTKWFHRNLYEMIIMMSIAMCGVSAMLIWCFARKNYK